MEQRPIALNKGNMIGASERAKARVKSWMQLADDVIEDTEKSERLNRHECKACFYSSRIGGAAMTYRPCMSCGTSVLYGSTNTDVLCMDCAKQHSLCKHCGGDLEMRTRRKDWPETPSPKDSQ
jgi:ribosomal protein S27E